MVELLKVLLKARSEDAGVASKLIATVADLEKIANDDRADSAALKGWRREAFGEDALKLKRGELALVLDGTRVRVVPVRRAAKGTGTPSGAKPAMFSPIITDNYGALLVAAGRRIPAGGRSVQ